jgi:hypothetical protein
LNVGVGTSDGAFLCQIVPVDFSGKTAAAMLNRRIRDPCMPQWRTGIKMALPVRAAVLCGPGWWISPGIVTDDQLAAVPDIPDESAGRGCGLPLFRGCLANGAGLLTYLEFPGLSRGTHDPGTVL